ncbi:MAG: hypothetical protein K2L70_03260 [Clostridia bacterium]|nr:hypothetical protein [Clostridia bacterium]
MGLFSNLFKKKDKPIKMTSDQLMTEFLQSKSLNGEKLNAKDYFAKDVLADSAGDKFVSALKIALRTNEIEICGNGVTNDWDNVMKLVTMSVFINEFDDDGIMVVLGVDGEANETDSVDIWVGAADDPTATVELDKYPDDATDASFIYENAAQKVKDFLSSKGLLK